MMFTDTLPSLSPLLCHHQFNEIYECKSLKLVEETEFNIAPLNRRLNIIREHNMKRLSGLKRLS